MSQSEQLVLPKPSSHSQLSSCTPTDISPCGFITISVEDREAPSAFHLLSCGHIIYVDDQDQTCGPNCYRIQARKDSVARVTHHDHAPKDPWDHLFVQTTAAVLTFPSTSSRNDAKLTLYCATCNGIPFDRHKVLSARTSNGDFTITTPDMRRCLALTKYTLDLLVSPRLLVPHRPLSDLAVNYFPSSLDSDTVHTLACNHEVVSYPPRPCAINCRSTCSQSASTPSNQARHLDAIICQECIFRAELVFKRWEPVGQGQ